MLMYEVAYSSVSTKSSPKTLAIGVVHLMFLNADSSLWTIFPAAADVVAFVVLPARYKVSGVAGVVGSREKAVPLGVDSEYQTTYI